MALQIGIVGLPNVGKSTLFKALTKKQVDIANYPFCTIEPNVGVVAVPDARLDALARISASKKIIPAAIEFVDIAGLVAGAHKGEGLGNKFLSHIREVNAIAHVLRGFTDPDITHVSNVVDPNADLEVIRLELIMADMATVEKRKDAVEGKARSGQKDAVAELAMLTPLLEALHRGERAASVPLTDDQATLVRQWNLLTMKPELVVMNVDEASVGHGATAHPPTYTVAGAIPISAKIEAELADLSSDDARAYMDDLGMKESGLHALIRASYTLLDLITFFTTGPEETRAWTVRNGAKAPEAAGVIHTDFEKGFIRAETYSWSDLVDGGSEAAIKEKGLFRLEGKEYVVKDGDVFHFRFAT